MDPTCLGGVRSTAQARSEGIFRLVMLWSPVEADFGQMHVLQNRSLVLGRTRGDCTLTLDDPRLAPVQAVLEPGPNGQSWRLRLSGGGHETFVNGRRVEHTELRAGDVIRLGPYLLLLQYLDSRACGAALGPVPVPSGWVGSGPTMQCLALDIDRARHSASTLVLGETGVGKELVARALHRASGRTGALINVNCGAIPSDLVESEFFGHVSGAFTGATARRGLFAAAENGTLFLDEIGEMPLPAQAKLLRAVALREIRPAGSDRARHIDVKIVAATNRDLQAAMAQGRFRPDLYARLAGAVIQAPPLRERREDILELARHFLRRGGATPSLSIDTAELLAIHDWPFNIRELEQCVEQVTTAGRSELRVDDLPRQLLARARAPHQGGQPASCSRALLAVRRYCPPSAAELRIVLAEFGGCVAKAAAFFGKERKQIYRWAKSFELEPEDFRDTELQDFGGAAGNEKGPAQCNNESP